MDEDDNQYNHQETRDGDSTEGSYSVALPDGRVQTVTYTVNGDGGFVAEVSYEGEAQYPEAPAPGSYQRAQPAAAAPAPQYAPRTTAQPQRSYAPRTAAPTTAAPRRSYSPRTTTAPTAAPQRSYSPQPTTSAPARYSRPQQQGGYRQPQTYSPRPPTSAPRTYSASTGGYSQQSTAAPSTAAPSYGRRVTPAAPSEEYGAPPATPAPRAAYPAYKTATSAPRAASYPAYRTSSSGLSQEYGAPVSY